MTENFFFCLDCLVARFSREAKELCPVCSMPMAISGWMQSNPEKGSESLPEPLAG